MRHELPVLSQRERTETQDCAHIGNKDIISIEKKVNFYPLQTSLEVLLINKTHKQKLSGLLFYISFRHIDS